MTDTATYDAPGLPSVTVTRETSATTGRSTYTISVELLGLDPVRSITSEERSLGITSISPPAVRGQRISDLIELAIVATGNAYEATDGYAIDPDILATISARASQASLQAFRLLGENV